MNEPRVPVFLAVGFWVASGLAVLSYTYIAYKETAGGSSGKQPESGKPDSRLMAKLTELKPKDRKKFQSSEPTPNKLPGFGR